MCALPRGISPLAFCFKTFAPSDFVRHPFLLSVVLMVWGLGAFAFFSSAHDRTGAVQRQRLRGVNNLPG
jgi:hypothetical protein